MSEGVPLENVHVAVQVGGTFCAALTDTSLAPVQGRALRVDSASSGPHARYRGVTGWAIDAAMHESRNVVSAVPVPAELLQQVKSTLIGTDRSSHPGAESTGQTRTGWLKPFSWTMRAGSKRKPLALTSSQTASVTRISLG